MKKTPLQDVMCDALKLMQEIKHKGRLDPELWARWSETCRKMRLLADEMNMVCPMEIEHYGDRIRVVMTSPPDEHGRQKSELMWIKHRASA